MDRGQREAGSAPHADSARDADAAGVGRMERALIASRDGYWERNLRTNVSWYSPSFRALLGFTEQELPNDRDVVNARLHPDDREEFLRRYEEAIRTCGTFAYEGRILDRNERWLWMRGRGRVWVGADGRPELISGAVSDVTAEMEALLELERQRHDLEQLVRERTASLTAALAQAEQGRREADAANEAKSRFLAHMSHEIRTPLNGILGLTELALRVTRSAAERRYLEVALQSGQALLQVINNVLDFSRIEAERVPINDEPFDLADAMAEAMRAVVPLVRAKRLSMLYDYLGDITWVRGDAPRLRQVLTNLIGNAAKFTERGHVKLSAQVVPAGPDRCVATLRVEDSGPGIAPGQLARLFDAFEQGDTSATRRHGGTGLGLSIARGLAQAMGGDIAAQSTPGAGATFTVTLPLGRADDPDPLPDPASGHAWLVYRRELAAELMQQRLERKGWTSLLFPGVPEAIAQARLLPPERKPALAMLPEHVLDADADLRTLRSVLPDTHIVLLVRVDWLNTRFERLARELGMPLMLLPLTPRDLKLVTGGDRLRPAAPSEPAPHTPNAQAPVLMVEDNEVNRMIGDEFLRALGLPTRVVASGEEALAACAQEPPSLVLMDLQMPGMDGFETARRLRAMQDDGRLPPFPIVALTAHALESDAVRSRAAGMDGFLSKPIMLESLRGELARWLPALREA
ncbi:PAS domain-containing hybrid sensor histidine kinase/response regulator [Piscinibacter sp. XHJ-5]|uniref:PAS domain-containing hybrid sensor histidine kinase/response regulator n=1 Tax=Piscinibacter sp. XHJ-5 TaxID=3037797 RepID=UPI0024535881|nr:PAS domain-containing hybrid sensor histidine kinase/response regulator [Piscinibacter sp. XHJ-5]